ncbi:MAG: peroxiredoxin [Rhodothalassiaceae bacterium]
MSLDVGDPALDFALPADGGDTIRLSDLRGRIVVLYFYPKDNTPGCTTEAREFSALADEFAALGATVIGVSKDSVATHERFRDKHGLRVRLASDGDGAVCDAYGVWQEKSLYGRRFMGIVRSTFLIDRDGRIARLWRKVRIKGHAAEVLAAARELA